MTAKDRGVERGVHVPYVVRGPGIKPLGITNELTDFSDVAPTLLEMAISNRVGATSEKSVSSFVIPRGLIPGPRTT